MYKIKKILFNNHPILGKLELDFCDGNGKAVDTVIFAGENGNGKKHHFKCTIFNHYELSSIRF